LHPSRARHHPATTRFDSGPSALQRAGSWIGAISFGPRVSVTTLIVVLAAIYLVLYVV
jgi:hypothetical protein